MKNQSILKFEFNPFKVIEDLWQNAQGQSMSEFVECIMSDYDFEMSYKDMIVDSIHKSIAASETVFEYDLLGKYNFNLILNINVLKQISPKYILPLYRIIAFCDDEIIGEIYSVSVNFSKLKDELLAINGIRIIKKED